jgi:hypothetical protein
MEVKTLHKFHGMNYVMVHVTEKEALEIIESLSRQLHSKNPNNNRVEHITDDQSSYFSIAVGDEEQDEGVCKELEDK